MPTPVRIKNLFQELVKKITVGTSPRLRKDYNAEQSEYLKQVDLLKDKKLDPDTLQVVVDLVGAYGIALLTITECEDCGLRADGMTVCKRCENEVHFNDTDSVNGNCHECEDELAAENEDDDDDET